ncbi:nucleoside diphosphate kinase regulator [Pigmentiphaga sp.]|uniref:nucleoside diphosphate kinase regulator n=1 Tax=Pigmentiphaga sp. TaxID=1977564 RepID=UPI00128C93E0|nr:nucleoside diphosphate kinase regulator [Pigmentiphaga sp.]MPS25530.1 nucleoside diphosphate kinase regulator [Alcaligenaceae bacterium SAGV5]MPS54144.1 nucleoside diphosphate kinase regulator [Alcaligenaceae bacterium SAGV3]MPT58843.1 nucleoside diphosphate kinase regulator [Alcaligenaceae bacterium]
MQTGSPHYITVNELDYVRLTNLLGQLDREPAAGTAQAVLAEALDQADQAEPREIPADIVTMHTRVEVEDDGGTRLITLCYPKEADAAKGMVSVFSPMGAALLGVRVPGRIGWTPPDGEPRQMNIVRIDYQPEANGDYTA